MSRKKGAFLWNDPDQNQLFKITQIMEHKKKPSESDLGKDSSVSLMHHDPNNRGLPQRNAPKVSSFQQMKFPSNV